MRQRTVAEASTHCSSLSSQVPDPEGRTPTLRRSLSEPLDEILHWLSPTRNVLGGTLAASS